MAAVHLTRPSFTLSRSLLAAFIISPLLTGCLSSDSGGSDNDTSTGKVNALGVSGLTYQTASQSGKTNTEGQFQYYPGETLSLWVGDLPIAEGVPAQEWVTPLEFFPDIRALLQIPSVDAEGLSTHTITEQQLINRVPVTNLTRFLIALNWTESVREGEGIEIRDRVIKQLNAALPKLTGPIDFGVSQTEFDATGSTPSPANQLLAEICFYPAGNELCEEPPTEADIDSAPERPENEDDWDPDVEYKQDLRAKKQRIIEAARSMEEFDAENARDYLKRELTKITITIGNRFYLDNHTAKHSVSDTSNKRVKIQRIGDGVEIADMDALTTRPQDVVLHSYSAQMAEVEYYVGGPVDGESEIVISFLPENTYRWVRKTLRVVITN
ncbi:organic solvent ABC transporter permease [Marinobacter sp. AC-23]|uniref:organic solvent ABC transporter permease n=1 Tax=Marinobacter sp. AC-23 TaxID=1879031 RepID=UPI0008DD17AB|nr:organic solvent ABC transporter permease [Marinobacter sp. AC-23]OHY83031.1 organic solvent ABC transporter permease [Marinobacter sp. AC-23]